MRPWPDARLEAVARILEEEAVRKGREDLAQGGLAIRLWLAIPRAQRGEPEGLLDQLRAWAERTATVGDEQGPWRCVLLLAKALGVELAGAAPGPPPEPEDPDAALDAQVDRWLAEGGERCGL
ncbi:MAG TPA: hypothetical protein VMY87_11880 [Armatimonadota bacterium]|nr:hypothetical protein [Armatimonadota bacterium]